MGTDDDDDSSYTGIDKDDDDSYFPAIVYNNGTFHSGIISCYSDDDSFCTESVQSDALITIFFVFLLVITMYVCIGTVIFAVFYYFFIRWMIQLYRKNKSQAKEEKEEKVTDKHPIEVIGSIVTSTSGISLKDEERPAKEE